MFANWSSSANLHLGLCSSFLLNLAELPALFPFMHFIILHSKAFYAILANCVKVTGGAVTLISLSISLSTLDPKLV